MTNAGNSAEEMDYLFRVIDLKQYVYCPRIAYYQVVLPDVRPLTYKMEKGIAVQEEEEKREQRRSLRVYGLADGRRSFNVPLSSPKLGLSGELDMLIETVEELIPVDYKLSKQVGSHFKLQLMAYGRLLEEIYPERKPVHRGFLYLIPQRKAIEVIFDKRLRNRLQDTIESIREIVFWDYFPPPTKQHRKCVDCEFRRFCNDIL